MELKNFERVTITGDDDDLVIPIENQADDTPNLSLCLVGRFLTDRTIRIPIPKKGVSIKEVDKGIFLFQFFHPINVKNVLKGGPWSFDKHFLLLSAPFCVQICNLPTSFMLMAVGSIANYLGDFLQYDEKHTSNFKRPYM
uniref:DUF4283 domain-containing protein n=1 Tax=Glycine max TaxID=3847 RepID=A0A0R0FCR5_SOYBN